MKNCTYKLIQNTNKNFITLKQKSRQKQQDKLKEMHHNQQQRFSVYSMSSGKGLQLSVVSVPHTHRQYQIKLPPISQPLISQYRNGKIPIDLFSVNKGFSFNIISELFCGGQSKQSISMCNKCQRIKQLNLCNFIVSILQTRQSNILIQVIRLNNKDIIGKVIQNLRKIDVFLTDQQIQYRLSSKFMTLGVILLDNHKLLLTRIIRNYIKHTIYYGEQHKFTLQNDYYFWFLIGIYYHIGVPKYLNQLESLPKDTIGPHQYIMFWMLDIIMKRLQDCSLQKIKQITNITYQYSQFFYPKQFKCLKSYDIDLKEIFYQWITQGMMGYMGIQFIGFYLKSILKQGYQYIQKTVMSYFQKRVVRLDRDQIISYNYEQNKNNMYSHLTGNISSQQFKKSKKQQVIKGLLDSNQQWPGIFFSTNVYDLKKE